MSRSGRLFLLAILCAVFLALQSGFAWETYKFLAHGESLPQTTLPLNRQVTLSQDFDALRAGDRLVALEGVAVASRGDVARRMRGFRPGQRIQVRIQRNGQSEVVTVEVPKASGGPDAGIVLIFLVLNIITPFSSILLGFFVAFRRPHGRLAWILLLVLLGLSQTLTANREMVQQWPQWAAAPMAFVSGAAVFVWALGSFLFGLDFPDPQSPQRLFAKLRWPVSLLMIFLAATAGCDQLRRVEFPNSALLEAINRVNVTPDYVVIGAMWFCLGSSFTNLFYKLKREQHPDMRRRLRLLAMGLLIGVLPLGLVMLWTNLTKQPVTRLPGWIWIPALSLVFIVPATLAYVLVVQRAMEVGVVLRQGVRYALARRSADVLFLSLGLLAAFTFSELRSATWVSWQRWVLLAVLVSLLLYGERGMQALRGWIDRQFFREAIHLERLLAELNQRVHAIADPEEVLRTVCERIGDALHISKIHPVTLPEHGAVRQRLERGPALVYFDRPASWMEHLANNELHALRQAGAELLLPVRANGELLTVLGLGPKRSEEPYSRADIELLNSVAAQTGLALQNARLTARVADQAAQRERLHREIEIARDVQMRLLPTKTIPVPGLDYAGSCRPAQQIGGDYFDYLRTPTGGLGLAIGDIAGKGIPASLLMSNLQAALRGLNLAGIADLRELFSKLNQLIFDATPSNRFATFFYVVYEPETGRAVFASAGHNPAALLRSGSEQVTWLRTKGVALGLTRKTTFAQDEIQLQQGDLLVLYTDGLTEAVNAQREEFGEERLAAAIRSHRDLPAEALRAALVQAVDSFAGDAPQHDDMTLIVARRDS